MATDSFQTTQEEHHKDLLLKVSQCHIKVCQSRWDEGNRIRADHSVAAIIQIRGRFALYVTIALPVSKAPPKRTKLDRCVPNLDSPARKCIRHVEDRQKKQDYELAGAETCLRNCLVDCALSWRGHSKVLASCITRENNALKFTWVHLQLFLDHSSDVYVGFINGRLFDQGLQQI